MLKDFENLPVGEEQQKTSKCRIMQQSSSRLLDACKGLAAGCDWTDHQVAEEVDYGLPLTHRRYTARVRVQLVEKKRRDAPNVSPPRAEWHQAGQCEELSLKVEARG